MNQLLDISWLGLWKNNPAMVQLLGLCPLLAVSSTVINGLGLGIATTLVLLGSNVTVSLVRQWIPKEIRIPVFVMIIAAFVTTVQLLMNAYTYDLYLALGIFIPLIVTNCAIIGRAEAFASKNALLPSALDGLMMGVGFSLVLVAIGAIRELLGQGTLLVGAENLFGPAAAGMTIQLLEFDQEFLIALLPPGAFLVMGFLIALKNIVDNAAAERQKRHQPAPTIERVRVSGNAE
ncbi:electron transport complex subunit E [Neiella marina]|uniref:Ion-translocating oxidoreductase complex subunit E n=1 Tax=Neiella holothuriorum TaxID=2870530 RepID=A0ABS7EG72_9GAMM|nr:electron transport complex subunit E [Neiella holothuriorum]MBW8190702.1 electron transport complex subunit E [Neiella holothuriorum]